MGCALTLPSKISVHSPQIHFATTRDGWRVALHRYEPRTLHSKSPVVLLVTSPHYNFNFWSLHPEVDFARFLAKRGWDVWALSFRGTGRSTRPGALTREWTFDDYVEKDLPAALSFIEKKTGQKKITCVGESFGGSILLAYLGSGKNSQVDQAVVLAPPYKYYLPLPDVFSVPPSEIGGETAFTYPMSEVLFFNQENIHPKIYKLSVNLAMEAISPAISNQFTSIVSQGEIQKEPNDPQYFKRLPQIKIPILLLCGKKDNLAPPEGVRAVYEQIQSKNKQFREFSRANFYRVDYGHDDLILGKWSKVEVYPFIWKWLKNEKS